MLWGWCALAASTAGAALIALAGNRGPRTAGGPSLQGDLLVVFSLVICLFWVLLNRHLVQRHSHIVVTVYGLGLGTLMLIVLVPARYGMPPVAGVSTRAWMALAGSGVLCTATTTLLWNWGMTQVPASQAGVLLNMEPLIGQPAGSAGAAGAAGPERVDGRRADPAGGGDADDAAAGQPGSDGDHRGASGGIDPMNPKTKRI